MKLHQFVTLAMLCRPFKCCARVPSSNTGFVTFITFFQGKTTVVDSLFSHYDWCIYCLFLVQVFWDFQFMDSLWSSVRVSSESNQLRKKEKAFHKLVLKRTGPTVDWVMLFPWNGIRCGILVDLSDAINSLPWKRNKLLDVYTLWRLDGKKNIVKQMCSLISILHTHYM